MGSIGLLIPAIKAIANRHLSSTYSSSRSSNDQRPEGQKSFFFFFFFCPFLDNSRDTLDLLM